MSGSEPGALRDLGELPATRASHGPPPFGSEGPGSEALAAEPPARAPRSGRGLGVASILCAIGMVIVTTGGSLLAGTSVGGLALPLAVFALALSVAAVVLGALALRHRVPRAAGALGLALGILLNPVLLALLLPAGTP